MHKMSLFLGDKSDQSSASPSDITRVSPGAYGASTSEDGSGQRLATAMLERMNMDIYALKKQYWRIQRRQQRAHVIYGSGNKDDDRGVHLNLFWFISYLRVVYNIRNNQFQNYSNIIINLSSRKIFHLFIHYFTGN